MSTNNGVLEATDKLAVQIYKTKEYDKFYLIEGNRNVKEKHVERLVKSMTEEQCMAPIQVNDKMEIIDGQHRFQACMRLKLPVYYYIVKGANLQTVQRLNSNTDNWKTDDYVKSYEELGINDYKIYREFAQAYGLSHRINVLLLSGDMGNEMASEKFNSGQFRIKNMDEAARIAGIITQTGEYYPGYKRRNWAYAILACMKNKKFDIKRFLHKCALQRKKLVDCGNTEGYIEVIEEVYNYGTRKDDKLVLRRAK